jgi:hypothetical protein
MVGRRKDVIPVNSNFLSAKMTLVDARPWGEGARILDFIEYWTIGLPNALCVLVKGHSPNSAWKPKDLRVWPAKKTILEH